MITQKGFTHIAIAILISVMALGFALAAWWYHSEQVLERNRICCGGTAEVNANNNTNTAIETVATCQAGCQQYGYEIGQCKRVGSSSDSLRFQEANKFSLLSTIATKQVITQDCKFSAVGAWDSCYCLNTNGALVTPTNTNSGVNLNPNSVTNGNMNSAVDTTGWETYTNSQYGFSFKYPPTMSVTEATTQYGTYAPLALNFSDTQAATDFWFEVGTAATGSTDLLAIFANTYRFGELTPVITRKTQVNVGSKIALDYCGVPAELSYCAAMLLDNGHLFTFNYREPDTLPTSILSTFQFTQ